MKTVKDMLDKKVPITNAEMIAGQLQDVENIHVSNIKIKHFMKQELGMKYRMSK